MKTNIIMKQKTSILSVTKAFFIFSTVICFSLSCTHGDYLKNANNFKDYEVIEIDECEYIQYGTSYGFLEITHKGNCKYCAERSKNF